MLDLNTGHPGVGPQPYQRLRDGGPDSRPDPGFAGIPPMESQLALPAQPQQQQKADYFSPMATFCAFASLVWTTYGLVILFYDCLGDMTVGTIGLSAPLCLCVLPFPSRTGIVLSKSSCTKLRFCTTPLELHFHLESTGATPVHSGFQIRLFAAYLSIQWFSPTLLHWILEAGRRSHVIVLNSIAEAKLTTCENPESSHVSDRTTSIFI